MKKCIFKLFGLITKKIKNKNKKFGESEEYWRIPVMTDKTEFILFTDSELEKARERSRKNPEDTNM